MVTRCTARLCAAGLVVLALLMPAVARSSCTGDCDGSDVVTVDEIIVLANIALGNASVQLCRAGDPSGDDRVTVDEVVAAVIDALNGCVSPPDTPTPIETPPPDPPDPTATPVPPLSIDVGSASGVAGNIVAIDVTLAGGQGIVTAASSDIAYDVTRVHVVVDRDNIACTINPSIGNGTLPAKSLLLGRLQGEGTTEILRLGLVSFSSTLPIPDGLLCTCEFEIAADASPGDVVLDNTPSAITALGERLSTMGADGIITIE